MHDDLDLFGDDDMAVPTTRGNANLDVQDYSRASGGDLSFLDDELQEDTPSRPGDGAGPAFDVDGVDGPFMGGGDAPGMNQTTYGAHPWGPGSGTGYRPASMQRTDNDLGSDDDMRETKPATRDAMYLEPEVAAADAAFPIQTPDWTGNRNQMPSNDDIDPETLYDRASYEYSDSSQSVIGNGIFDMEEGVTWRPRSGAFANQYALPAYLADEDELGVQQSEMFDTTANNWRVTQVSSGGVALTRKVPSLKPIGPFGSGRGSQAVGGAPGPRSHIEAFGRSVASAVVSEAQAIPSTPQRSAFLTSVLNALGPRMAERANQVAARLVAMGYPSANALEDVICHAVMHAAVRDLMRGSGRFRRLDRFAGATRSSQAAIRAAGARHIAPLARDQRAMQQDMAALRTSPAAQGMGQLALAEDAISDDAPSASGALVTTRNVLIAGAVAGVGYLAWTNRKKITRNAKKLAKRVGL